LAQAKSRGEKIAATLRMLLWGYTGNVVWTDSVQGGRENKSVCGLSLVRFRFRREACGEIESAMGIGSVLRRGERFFVSM
jgi:hypothetical protein